MLLQNPTFDYIGCHMEYHSLHDSDCYRYSYFIACEYFSKACILLSLWCISWLMVPLSLMIDPKRKKQSITSISSLSGRFFLTYRKNNWSERWWHSSESEKESDRTIDNRMRNNRLKLLERRFKLAIRRNFLIISAVCQWNRLPNVVVNSVLLEVFK